MLCCKRLLLLADEGQWVNIKDFCKLVVKLLVAWTLPWWEYSANTTNQVIFFFHVFPFLSLFYFAAREAVYQHTTACSKGPCRRTPFKARVAASERRKAWCRSVLSAAETFCRRPQDDWSMHQHQLLLPLTLLFFPRLPFRISLLGLQEMLRSVGGERTSPFKKASRQTREAPMEDFMLSTRLTLPKPVLHSIVNKIPMLK